MVYPNAVALACTTPLRSFRPVKLDRLAEKLTALQTILSELTAEIETAKAGRDVFAMHVFTARAEFAKACESELGKSHRRSDESARASWKKARALGYRGEPEEWLRVLCPRRGQASGAAVKST